MALAIANSTGAGPVAADSLTFAHDAGSADRRWTFVKVGVFSAGEQPTVSGVTYNGVALSLVRAAVESYAGGANIVREETWALEAPASGSNNVVVSLSGAADSLTAVAVTFSDCGGDGPNTGAVNGNISDISMGITSTAATSILLGGWRGAAVRGVTEGTGVTLIAAVDDGTAPPNNKLQWVGEKAATGGSDTWAITLNSATRSAATVVEVLEDLGGGGPTYTLALDAGSYTLTGNAAGLLAARLLSLEAGSYTLTGQDADLLRSFLLSLETGSYTLTGNDTNLLRQFLIALDTGTYSLTGQAAGLLASRLLALDAGSYTATGNDISLLASRLLSLDAGAYTLTGQDASLIVSRLLALDAGAYTVTGNDVTLTYNPAGGPTYTLSLDAGSYTLTGNAAGLLASRLLQLDAGAYTVTGNDAQVLASRLLSLDAGAYTLSGQDAALAVSRLLQLDAGSYTISGFAVTLDYSGEVVGAIVELSDAAAHEVGLTDAAAYAVVLQDGALYVVALEDELL